MRKFVFLFLALLSLNLGAQEYVAGEGKFHSTDDDSQSEIKRQLLGSAFQDVLTRELKSMNLDSAAFWRKYEEKFEESFKSVQEEAQQKITAATDAKKRVEVEKSLRAKRLEARSAFGRLGRAISSYSIKKMSRSTQNPNMRFLSIQAQVNREILGQIFRKFTSEGKFKNFTTMYLSFNYDMDNLSASELGVDSIRDLTSVVDGHWKKWLEEALKGEVDEVLLASESDAHRFQEAMGQRARMEAKDKWSSESGPMAGSLWLKVDVALKKAKGRELAHERSLLIAADYVLLDLGTGASLSSGDFIPTTRSFSTDDPQVLSSGVANAIYHLPMSAWGDMKKDLAQSVPGSSDLTISVSNLNSIEDLMKLRDYLAQRGAAKQLRPQLSSYSGRSGELKVGPSTGSDELGIFLLTLENSRISDSKAIAFRSKDSPFIIELKDVAETAVRPPTGE